MKRFIIFLTVCTLLLAGCGKEKEDTVTENRQEETASQVEETKALVTESAVTAALEATETDTEAETKAPSETDAPSGEKADSESRAGERKTEESKAEKQEADTSKNETKKQTENSETATPEKEQEKEQPATVTETEKVKTAEYNPNEVVSLATAKTKAYGKISIPEDLDQMLAAGEITQAEHDEYYPYDGAGYYSVFVETDLNRAATTSGRKLGSVEGIADYIAEMLSLESGPYFYIEYAGVTSTGGTDFYEFRCYRA
ncbi:MAG: hypothetical protein J6A08_06525 [Lachnospiraceae bacterium]|nr:hypothetical protein [Lachnospiraceae bacterium]